MSQHKHNDLSNSTKKKFGAGARAAKNRPVPQHARYMWNYNHFLEGSAVQCN